MLFQKKIFHFENSEKLSQGTFPSLDTDYWSTVEQSGPNDQEIERSATQDGFFC